MARNNENDELLDSEASLRRSASDGASEVSSERVRLPKGSVQGTGTRGTARGHNFGTTDTSSAPSPPEEDEPEAGEFLSRRACVAPRGSRRTTTSTRSSSVEEP